MAQRAYDRRHDHSRDERPMSARFPAAERKADHLTIHAPAKFDAKEVLRRSGLRFKNEGRAAVQDASGIGDALARIGAGDFTGQAGNVLLAVLGGLLGLIMLDLLIGPRGSTVLSKAAKWTGGAIGRLVDPVDPLTSPAGGSAAAPSSAPPAAKTPTPAATTPNNGGTVPKPTK